MSEQQLTPYVILSNDDDEGQSNRIGAHFVRLGMCLLTSTSQVSWKEDTQVLTTLDMT